VPSRGHKDDRVVLLWEKESCPTVIEKSDVYRGVGVECSGGRAVMAAMEEGILVIYKYAWWAEDWKGQESDVNEVGPGNGRGEE
jgi:hypothetical protein